MEKILMALMVLSFTYLGANAQATDKNYCGVSHGKVCKGSKANGYHCYKTKYAQNFKVCKSDFGYFICCENPSSTNTTHAVLAAIPSSNQRYSSARTAPENQSFPWENYDQAIINSRSYEGYYQPKSSIKVCYTGNNVAALTRAPYQGCPSPQSEGPEVNNVRNLNVATPNANMQLAPINGNSFR